MFACYSRFSSMIASLEKKFYFQCLCQKDSFDQDEWNKDNRRGKNRINQ